MLTFSPPAAADVSLDRPGIRLWRTLSRERFWIVAITVVAFALRMAFIRRQSFWLDETATVVVLRGNPTHVWHTLQHLESNGPVYYALAWLWSQVTGLGELGLRSLSVVVGTAVVPVTYAAVRRLVNQRAAMFAAILTAVCPFSFWYSQEARNYSLYLLLAMVTILALARVRQQATPGRLTTWSLAAGTLVATHYFGVFLVVGEGLVILALLRGRRGRELARAVALAVAPVTAICLALAPLALTQRESQRASWIARAGTLMHRATEVFPQFTGGPISFQHPGLAWILVTGVVVLSIVALSHRSCRPGATVLGVCFAAVFLLPFVVALAGNDYMLARNLAPGAILLTCLAAIGLSVTPGKATPVVVAGALVVALLGFDANQIKRPDFQGWRAGAAALGAPVEGRIILVTPNSNRIPLIAYRSHVRDVHDATVTTNRVVILVAHRLRSRLGHTDSLIPPPAPGFRESARSSTRQFLEVTFTSPRPITFILEAYNRLLGLRMAPLVEQAHGDAPTPTI